MLPGSLTRLLRLLPVAALLAAAAPTLASPAPPAAAASTAAGTLVYVKGTDVYVARPDGSGERRLTRSGTAARPWVSPSSANDGTVVAARGPVVYRMDQWGTVLGSFDPPDGTDTAGDRIGGDVSRVAISPDGARIAYTYQHYTCPPRLSCKTRWLTLVSAADRLTSPATYGPSPYDNPTWVSGRRLLLNGRDADGVVVFDIGVKNSFWFNDGDGSGYYTGAVTDPALSRDGSVLAAVYDGMVVTYAMNGDVRTGTPPPTPTPTCGISDPAGGLAGPTVAPDASALAWEQPDGVWVKAQPLACDVQPALAVPGASQPAWSAAPLQTTRPADRRFTLLTRPAVSGRAVPGRRLTATAGRWSPTPATVSYQWLRNGRAIKQATRSTYRVVKVDRGRRLSVRVTVTAPGYVRAVAASTAVRVR